MKSMITLHPPKRNQNSLRKHCSLKFSTDRLTGVSEKGSNCLSSLRMKSGFSRYPQLPLYSNLPFVPLWWSLWSDHHCDQMLILWWNHYYWCSHVWSRPGWVALEDPEFESSATQAGKLFIKTIIGIIKVALMIRKVKVMYLAPRSKKWKLWTWHPEFQKIWGMKFEESALVPWSIISGYFLPSTW